VTKLVSESAAARRWRAGIAVALGVGVAVTAAACAGGPGTATSPSGVGPSSLAAAGGVVKNFTMSIQETSIPAGAGVLHVTVTNSAATSSSQGLGSVSITVPAGLTVTSVGGFSSASGKTWTNSTLSSGQTVIVGATTGTQKLDPTQSVSFTIGVTASVCQPNTFASPIGSNETADTFTPSAWDYVGSTLTVTVTDCPVDCPAAPSIAAHYLHNVLGMQPNSDPYKNIVAQVANHMTTDARFDGLLPCDAGYAAAVIAFVDAIVASL
jgi:hypothetical protein